MSQEQIAGVLAEHHPDGGFNYDLEWQICTCGTSYAPRTHAAHVAAALVPLIVAAQAEAWDAGRGSANVMLPVHPPKMPSNPYRVELAAMDPECRALVHAIHDRKAQG